MQFDVSTRFQTNKSQKEIMDFLEQSFRKNSSNVSYNGDALIVETINPTFGSINRKDITTVDVKPKDNEILISAAVNYEPSIMFWIFFIVLLFTAVTWIIPIAFYLFQKKTVKTAIEEIFTRAEHEFKNSQNVSTASLSFSGDTATQLEKLADLKNKGVLSQEEFDAQKKKLMGM